MNRNFVAVILAGTLIAALPAPGKSKKLSGQILDQQGFRNVHSYCIQVQDIGSRYAGMVKSFLKEQGKPNSLVNQLPWKLVNDCSQADAVMSFQFSEVSEYGQASGGGGASAGAVAPLAGGNVQQTWFEVTAVVSNRSDQKPVYQVRGARAPERGERALEKTFKELAKDLKSTE